MLFRDDDLASVFDFGNVVSDADAKFTVLADKIHSVTQDLAEKKHPVLFRHTDNHGKPLCVQVHQSRGENEIYDRSPEEIRQILYRKGRASTIAGFLLNLGIEKPEENTSDFKEYLQLLYFFYMLRYFAFEDDSFFRMFAKTPTSELSPVEGASQGKYLWFILGNLMDDKRSCDILVKQDFGYSTMISIITNKINDYISEKNSIFVNNERAREIDGVLGGCDKVPPREWHGGIILRAMDALYQYQMLGYSGDMIRNLTSEKRLFDFPELEIEAPVKKWSERLLENDQIEGFLKEKETAIFCKQNKNVPRPDKALRNRPTEIVRYIFGQDQKQGNHIFVQEGTDGKVRISALDVAVIARTYIELEDEKLLVDIKKKNGWDHDVSFKNALIPTKGAGEPGLAADLAYRLFIVAVHSERLNTIWGHGYWLALFEPIYLRNYVYVQKCVNCAFSGRNPNEWRDRLYYLIYNLPYIDPEAT